MPPIEVLTARSRRANVASTPVEVGREVIEAVGAAVDTASTVAAMVRRSR